MDVSSCLNLKKTMDVSSCLNLKKTMSCYYSFFMWENHSRRSLSYLQVDPMIFHFKIGQFSFHKFRLAAILYWFRCLLAIFHTKIMLVLYDMGLFFNSTICRVTFDSRD